MEKSMEEREKQRVVHLFILVCVTLLILILALQAAILGWEPSAVVLLVIGIIASWIFHITDKIPAALRLWFYAALSMLAFFFFGVHQTSLYDLAPVMVIIIFVYCIAENNRVILCCAVTYVLTLGYSLFMLRGSAELETVSYARLGLHLLLILFAAYVTRGMIQWQIKDRRRTDEKIGELEEINRRTEDFLTNVSHELRTPINAVTGITAVMLKSEEDVSKRDNILSVQMAGHRLFGQIEDILDYTEIETDRMTVSEDDYMISSIVNDIVSGQHLFGSRGGVELIFDIDAQIPAMLHGDGRKIKKILRHLIDNSVKFTKRGGVYVRVYALEKDYGVNLCVQVSDTGIGISQKDMGKITERFYQSSSGRSRRAGGLGLGLSIVHGMVTAMGGFMRIDSTLGNGTMILASIPQKVTDGAPAMTVKKRESLCLGCFLRTDKYEVAEVRDYYNFMISHMVSGLGLTLHRAASFAELQHLTSVYRFTHIFIAREEYEENSAYFEGLDRNVMVVVIADERLRLPKGSRVKVIKKPFYCLSISNLLNAGVQGAEAVKEKHMLCPGVKALVVDDEPMNLRVSEGIFRAYQMQVKTAGSGMEAIELCGQEEFDIIFLDHMMPEMDGVETLKRLRKIHTEADRALTIVAFTANAVSGAREMFLREGFDEFVSKPIEPFELERVLRKLLPKTSVIFADDEYFHKASGAEEQEEQTSGADKMLRLIELGLDTEAGMRYCGNDMEFYEEMLERFVKDYAAKSAEINGFYEKGDLVDYQIKVHALKSSAKIAGAAELSELARKLEEAAKNKNAEYCAAHHAELNEAYEGIVQSIAEIFGISRDQIFQASQEDGDPTAAHLNRLQEALDSFEADKAEEALAALADDAQKDETLAALLEKVRAEVQSFEFGAAFEMVEAYRKGGEA